MQLLKNKNPNFLPHLGCDFEVGLNRGQLTILAGENGIGKSTLLRSFYLEKKTPGMVFAEQSPADVFFDRKLSKFREILLQCSTTIDHSYFEKYWMESGLKEKEGRLLSQLSGGEGQLLKLISTCSSDAETYLLDEPGQYLDKEKKKLVNEMMEALKQKGKYLLVVEHDWSWISPGAVVKELTVENNELKEKRSWTI